MKTGSSTSALIFIFFPIYSVILGGVGYACGYFFNYLAQKKISRID